MEKVLLTWNDLLDELEKALRELEQHMTKEEFVLFLDSLYKFFE